MSKQKLLRTKEEIAEHIKHKRGSMTVTGFAESLGITRRTAYKHLKGSLPSSAITMRMLGLEHAVIAIDDAPLKIGRESMVKTETNDAQQA